MGDAVYHEVGPGAFLVAAGAPASGTATFPRPQASLRVAARWLEMLNGAQLANWAQGVDGAAGIAVFVTGDLANELSRIAGNVDKADSAAADIRVAAARMAAVPRWRRWLHDRQPGYWAATRVYEAAGWFIARYRERYGDDGRFDDMDDY